MLEPSPLILSCLPLPGIFLRDELEWTRTRVAASEIRPLEASIIAKPRSHLTANSYELILKLMLYRFTNSGDISLRIYSSQKSSKPTIK